ncbi:MarR family winged helix-turn-helix transcriptional regulator [Microbacterium sp.]|uniref:MarR family winged helix-turn-helix transcriptional regulator n=1 Tax=Microbacterium sp. TaxID=51671 RepID=UPI003A8DD63E
MSTHPPSDVDKRAYRSLVMLSHLLQATLDRSTRADAGLPHGLYTVLALLYDAPEHRIRLKRLAQDLRFSPSRLSHAIKRLESLGLLQRVDSEVRGKSWDAVLTPAGIAMVRHVAPRQMRAVRDPLLAVLSSDEAAQLAVIAEKLNARLESLEDSGGVSTRP